MMFGALQIDRPSGLEVLTPATRYTARTRPSL